MSAVDYGFFVLFLLDRKRRFVILAIPPPPVAAWLQPFLGGSAIGPSRGGGG